ncbi:MAG: hypothetical protein A4E66_01443 [Syntrophus sp. PtaB.Bin001]|nr:MAG: hypothetical protein A4E66_01443 [Syntrophus sp. PtaB.Bin001]
MTRFPLSLQYKLSAEPKKLNNILPLRVEQAELKGNRACKSKDGLGSFFSAQTQNHYFTASHAVASLAFFTMALCPSGRGGGAGSPTSFVIARNLGGQASKHEPHRIHLS